MSHIPVVVVFVSAGVKVDGGGFWIDGAGHIHVVGPWDPQVRSALDAASSLVGAATVTKDEHLSGQIRKLGESVLAPHVGALQGVATAAMK